MQTDMSTSLQKGVSGTPDTVWGGADTASGLFTKLLVAQIKNQDPLEPTNPSEFVSQLTQLSEMESLQKLASQVIENSRMIQDAGGRVECADRFPGDGHERPRRARRATGTCTHYLGQCQLAGDARIDRAGWQRTAHHAGRGRPGFSRIFHRSRQTRAGTGQLYAAGRNRQRRDPLRRTDRELTKVMLSAGGAVFINVANVGDVLPDALTEFNGRQTSTTN